MFRDDRSASASVHVRPSDVELKIPDSSLILRPLRPHTRCDCSRSPEVDLKGLQPVKLQSHPAGGPRLSQDAATSRLCNHCRAIQRSL